MPIKSENRARYPKDWAVRSRFVRFYRAKNRCEWCGAMNYAPHPETGSRVVLTCAHVNDHRPEACSLMNLAALCQRCHNRHDAKRRAETRKKTMNHEEHKIQAEGVKLCRMAFPICRQLLYAIPNGGARDVVTGKRLKDEGVLRGVFDLALDVPRCFKYMRRIEYFGLKIEVKTPAKYATKNHGLSKEQMAYKAAVEEYGYKTAVVCTAQGIVDAVVGYLKWK